MRVTNKIIQNNSVNNININKTYQDKLNNQMATEKKIVRPSDDPVVAIRALRLRTNVSQVTQYYSKNIPDAESWLDVTEAALKTVSSVITDMIEQCTKGSSEKLTSTDRQTILDALNALRDEVYSTGNADYAGRSVFTGYRTDETLMFTESANQHFNITEQVNNDALDTVRHITGLDAVNEINEGNYESSTVEENDIQENTYHRIRLSYDNLDNASPSVQIYNKTTKTYDTIPVDVVSQNDYKTDPLKDPYSMIDTANKAGTEKAVLIYETGEILISDKLYERMSTVTDDVTTPTFDESQIRIVYDKSVWKKGDLKPEHYFACTDMTDSDPLKHIKYNQDYLTGMVEKQSIEYDVGISQSIRVNTTADEVFTHSIGRDVDDMIASLTELTKLDETLRRLNKIRDGLDSSASDYQTKYDELTREIDAANKAFTFLKEKNQSIFEKNITSMQKHLNKANEATTACGTRQKKLELISNRLMSQKTNFETLESENENVDLTEVAIQLSGAELTYQAALMSTSKILQTSLMNYL